MNKRFKDGQWTIPPSLGSDNPTMEGATLAVLMDLRDELQGMRRRLDCVETLSIPRMLKAIQKNTTKRRRKKRPA